MTLPVELLQRRPAADRYDVAVVGAGVGGLVCGAILARGGLRVTVVDVARRPGGQIQTIAHQGYAVDIGPTFWDGEGFSETLAIAGVDQLALGELVLRDALRVAVVENGGLRDEPRAIPVPGNVPSPSILDAVRSLHGVPPRVFASLGGLFEELVKSSPEQLDASRRTTLREWLEERGTEAVVAGALLRSCVLLGAVDVDAVTVPVLTGRLRALAAGARPTWIAPADNPVAGARGVVQALVDSLIEAGGELRLGTRVVGVSLDRGRLRSLAVAREEHPFLDEIVADRCVLALPRAGIERVLPPPVWAPIAATAPAVRVPSALGMAWAFRSPPPAEAGGPGVVLRLVGPLASAGSALLGAPAAPITLFWPSALAPRVAPPGESLLVAHAPIDRDAARDVAEVTRVALLLRSVVRRLVPDPRESILWERHWLRSEAAVDPFAAPVLPLSVPGCDGVLLAGADVAVPGGVASGVAAAALAGRAAAERILAPLREAR